MKIGCVLMVNDYNLASQRLPSLPFPFIAVIILTTVPNLATVSLSIGK